MIAVGMDQERRKIAQETMGKLVAHKMRTGELKLTTLIAAIIEWHPVISKKFHIYLLQAEVDRRLGWSAPDYESIRILNRHIDAYDDELKYGYADLSFNKIIANQAEVNGIWWCTGLRMTAERVTVFSDEQKFNKIMELLIEEAGLCNSSTTL